MERDFMGLHAKAKDAVVVVKDEAKDAVNDAAAANSNMFWGGLPSHKTTPLSQFMSFKSVPEDNRTKRFTLEHHMPSVFHPGPAPDGFEKKSSFGFAQRNHSVAVPNAHVNHLSRPIGGNGAPAIVGQDIGSFTFPNHSVPMTIGGGSFYTVQGAGSVKQHVLGGVPVTTSNFLAPVSGSHVGTYASRSNEKISDDPEQLTIFYRGAVNVFSNITPEKAQAIMYLAGTVSPVTAAPTLVGAQAQAPIPSRPEPCSGLSSPISVTSNPRTQSGSGSSNPDELMTSNLATPLTLTSTLPVPVTQTITSSILLQNAVPQARKASLARFLEKRKERAINAGPYTINQQISEVKNVRDEAGASSQLLSLGQENRVSTLQTRLQL